MARELTGIRVAKVNVVDLNASSPESVEVDFKLSDEEAVEIISIECNVEMEVDTATTATEEGTVTATVHLENDNLETVWIDRSSNDTELDSEIIFDKAWHVATVEETGAGQSLATLQPVTQQMIYKEMIGDNLVVAFNPTVRGDVSGDLAGNLTVNISWTFYFRYVKLSDKEIVDAFRRSR